MTVRSRTHYTSYTFDTCLTPGPGDVEMQSYNGGAAANPNAILDECREVDRALDDLDGQLANLDRVFRQSLARPDMPSGEINSLSSQIMSNYRGLVTRVKSIKSKPDSGHPRNAPQVGKVDRRLKATINKYQTLEADFRRDSQAAAERQYRIVRPDATEQEVRDAVADPDAPIFQQAVSTPICRLPFMIIAYPFLAPQL